MTQSVATSVAQLKQHRTALNTYVQDIGGEYTAYVNHHGSLGCLNYYVDGTNGGRSWNAYRDQVKLVKGYITEYVDDTEWIGQLRTRSQEWKTANGHATEAGLDLAESKLPAVGSWKGPAGRAYREVVPTMTAATHRSITGTGTMQTAADKVADAGQKFFATLEELMGTLVTSLRHYPIPVAANPQPPLLSAPPPLMLRCLSHSIWTAGEHPWTAYDDYKTAKETLRTEVTEACRLTQAGAPGPPRYVSVDDYLTTWPKAPGGN